MFNAAMLNAIKFNRNNASKVRFTTFGGAVYTAPVDQVNIFPNIERVFALWDFRHGMTHDTHFNKSVPFSAIESVEYVK